MFPKIIIHDTQLPLAHIEKQKIKCNSNSLVIDFIHVIQDACIIYKIFMYTLADKYILVYNNVDTHTFTKHNNKIEYTTYMHTINTIYKLVVLHLKISKSFEFANFHDV